MTGQPAADPLLVVAGEASGDLHGARLLSELHRLDARPRGLRPGRATSCAPPGSSPWRTAPRSRWWASPRCCASCRAPARSSPCCSPRSTAAGPVAAVLIDFPDFNLRLARELAEARRAGRLLHQPAGLGLAPRPGQDDRPAGGPHAGALPVRGRLLPRAPASTWSTSAIRWSTRCRSLPSAWDGSRAAESGPFRIALLPGSRRQRDRGPPAGDARGGAAPRPATLPVEVRADPGARPSRETCWRADRARRPAGRASSPRTASPRSPTRTSRSAPPAPPRWRWGCSARR